MSNRIRTTAQARAIRAGIVQTRVFLSILETGTVAEILQFNYYMPHRSSMFNTRLDDLFLKAVFRTSDRYRADARK